MGKSKTRKQPNKAATLNQNEQKRTDIDQETNPDNLIELGSDSGTSTDDEVPLTSSRKGPPNNPKKKQRVFNEDDMEVVPNENSSKILPSSGKLNDEALQHENAAATIGSTGVNPNQASVLPDVQARPISGTSTSLDDAITGLGAILNVELNSNRPEPSTDDPSKLNQSRHAKNPEDVTMDDDVDNDDVPKFWAAVPFDDVKRDKETKKQLIARVENFLLEQFDTLTKVYYVKKLPTSNPLIVAILIDKTQHS